LRRSSQPSGPPNTEVTDSSPSTTFSATVNTGTSMKWLVHQADPGGDGVARTVEGRASPSTRISPSSGW